ncbi:MAG TPA: hypothetical protein VD905_01285 [Flavobacteriales bacterium]|nr:hypothetical protein [Flavobacteriales bacterium]
MHKSVSIIGYGWLGAFLAEHYKKLRCPIKASTTSPAKLQGIHEKGFRAHLFDLTTGIEETDTLLNSSIHFLCIPPSKLNGNYAECLMQYVSRTAKGTKIVFISSTSVYPKENGLWHEESPVLTNNMTEAEKAITNYTENYLILRCAGLFGPERDPAFFLSGKSGLSGMGSTVSLVHVLDICRISGRLIQKDLRGVFNMGLTAPYRKKELYSRACIKRGIPVPEFNEQNESVERYISSEKAIAATECGFDHTQNWFESL